MLIFHSGEKKRRGRSGDPDTHSPPTSVSPGELPILSSPMASTAPDPPLFPVAQTPPFPNTSEPRYISGPDYGVPVSRQAYPGQPNAEESAPFSYSPATSSGSYPSQPASYVDLPHGYFPYAESGHPLPPYLANRTSVLPRSDFPDTPITPTSHGDNFSTSYGVPYGGDYVPSYERFRDPNTDYYANSATSVNTSGFLTYHYSSA